MKLLFLMTVALALQICGAAELQLNLVSDLHYDRAYGTAPAYGKCTSSEYADTGVVGCDTPERLVKSTVTDLQNQASVYTLFMGDWLRHHFYPLQVSLAKTTTFLASQVATIHGPDDKTPTVMDAVGNNDLIPDYYFNWEQKPNLLLQEQATILQKHGLLTAEEVKTREASGFYSRDVSDSLRVVSLHTTLWAFSLLPSLPPEKDDPCGQFAFLEEQLTGAASSGKKVIIIGHIPPYLNLYKVVKQGSFSSLESDMYWRPEYQTRFSALVKKYSDVVVLQAFGHVNRFMMQASPSVGVLSVTLSSIAPAFNDAPSYFVANFDDTFQLKNLRQRVFNLKDTAWNEGQSVEAMFGGDRVVDNLEKFNWIIHWLRTNDTLWEQFVPVFAGGVSGASVFPNGKCDTFCRGVTACSMMFSEYEDIMSCVNPTHSFSHSAAFIVVVCVLAVIVLIICVLIGVWFFCRGPKAAPPSGRDASNDVTVESASVAGDGGAAGGWRSATVEVDTSTAVGAKTAA